MKLTAVLLAVITLSTVACSSTPAARGPNSAGLEISQMPGYVNNAKVYRLKDHENGVVCYGAVASDDSAHATAGHFNCLPNPMNRPNAPVAIQTAP